MQAQVYKIHSDFYYVKNSKHEEFTCKIRDVLKKQKIEIKVGDFVELTQDGNFISSLSERKNSLNRPKVSNIDYAVIVCALKEPELDFVQLDRYLSYLKYNNIESVICFNKEDLVDNLDEKKLQIKDIYENLNYKTFFISAKDKLDLDDLTQFLSGKTVVFCGMSGVGKSTLLNTLIPNISLRTGNVSIKTQCGCHTTRHCEIIETENFKIIDTPGFSCLKFDFLLPEKIIELFDDLTKFKKDCKYSDCLHDVNINGVCSIYDNLDKIVASRYKSYLTFLEEAKEYKELISKRSIKNEGFNKKIGNRLGIKISKRKRTASRNTEKQKIKDVE